MFCKVSKNFKAPEPPKVIKAKAKKAEKDAKIKAAKNK